MEQLDHQQPQEETFRMEANCNTSRCSTSIRSIEFKHVWEIGQFSVHQEICSPGDAIMGTSFGDDDHEFLLKLFPAGKDEECSGYLSVFLQISKAPHAKLQFRVNFVIQTLDGPRGCALNKSVVTINRGGIVTASKFFSLEQLKNRAQRMCPDDKLTIECDMVVYGEYHSVELDLDGEHMVAEMNTLPSSSNSRFSLAPQDFCGSEGGLESLLDSGAFSDFEVFVEGECFKLHRNILTTRSKYFYGMLKPGNKEFDESKVELKDVSKDVMRKLINYIYSLRVPDIDEDTVEVIYAADMFMIDGLKTRLVDTMCKNITLDNVCQRLELGDKLNEDRLFQKAVVFFARNRGRVVGTEDWKKMREMNPSLVARVCEVTWDLMENPCSKRRRTNAE